VFRLKVKGESKNLQLYSIHYLVPAILLCLYVETELEGYILITHIMMDGKSRINIRPGLEVAIVLKEDQRSGDLTEGIVKDILTNSQFHPHGIKVRLTTGEVGRVKHIKS
jgi:uncharacterized repeat protein (TIGR03833 family)